MYPRDFFTYKSRNDNANFTEHLFDNSWGDKSKGGYETLKAGINKYFPYVWANISAKRGINSAKKRWNTFTKIGFNRRKSCQKKMIIVMQNLKFGGAEKILITFLNRFDREKYTVNLILHTKEGELINEVPPDVSIKGIVPVDNGKLINKIKRSIFFKLSKYFPIILKICLNVYLGSADINIAYMEGITTKIVSFLKGPKVAWVHTDLENNSWTDVFFKNLDDQKNTYEKFKKIVFVSEGGKTAFNNKFKNTAQDRQVVIHNPIDNVQIEKKAKIVDNDFNKWAKKTENTVRLISVGRTDPVKRYGLLIKAVTKMIDRNESVTLTIIGDGQDTHKLIDLATGYNCFYFVGFKENPLPYVKKE
ncbi:glycosyltransferase [Paucilactobacillus hokkaidonensis]|uniref:glycosyltransferase n=1 Tax=Paucilactobacillus hokkaidonensis TaxID=1193095 RepID=UPI000A6BC00F|nr:glycosyltransferase [Paucilactobacillus hokkaidonensis]